MTYIPRAAEEEISSAVSILRGHDPVESAYRLLAEVASRHGLQDAWLVLHPPSRAPQLFRLGGGQIPAADVLELAARPTGLYSEPPIEPPLGAALGILCEAEFAVRAAAFEARFDVASGMSSRWAMEVSLERAAARAARHRWSTTVVLVSTAGPGDEDERWQALGAALRSALRSGDEAGAAGVGTAIALLGNAGADAVRPFLARVRAALSESGWSGVDLLAATATTPEESVDPSELWRLAAERLADVGGEPPAPRGPTVELALRLLPSVAFVGTEHEQGRTKLTVVRVPSDSDGADVIATVRGNDPELVVEVVVAGAMPAGAIPVETVPLEKAPVATRPGDTADVATSADAPPAPSPTTQTVYAQATALLDVAQLPQPSGHTNGTNGTNGHRHLEDDTATPPPSDAAPLLSATVPGGTSDPGSATRVTLVGATFDPARGMCEVTLSNGRTRATGRAPAGPLAGGAQATLLTLGALGLDVPFYLVSADRLRSVPGSPVVVVLSPRGEPETAGRGERIGVAAAPSDVEAASRATLGALNRFLAGLPA